MTQATCPEQACAKIMSEGSKEPGMIENLNKTALNTVH